MRILRLPVADRQELFRLLEDMPEFLERALVALPAATAALPGPGGTWSGVEHCWHLADLEREGYAVRLQHLLHEADPYLPDFDGARLARERNYRALSAPAGIAAFREARATNLRTLRALDAAAWERSGTQEGIGRVALCDIPSMMAEHDAGHRREIEAWLAANVGR